MALLIKFKDVVTPKLGLSIKLRNWIAIFSLSLYTSIAIAQTASPNIIFILADDLGWQDVGFMGNTYIETPNIDKLASSGTVFKNAYMYPTCSPSRAAIATGRHSFRTDCYMVPVLERGAEQADKNIYSRWTVQKKHTFYSMPLNRAGYKLAHLGKWHLVGPYPESEKNYPFNKHLVQPASGDFSWIEHHLTPDVQQYYPEGRGFHKNVGGTFWGDPARGYKQGYRAPLGGYIAPYKNPFLEEGPEGEWLTDRLTTEAIHFMERNKNEPFFVQLQFYSPHMPMVARSEELMEYFMNKKPCEVTGHGAIPEKREIHAKYATMVKSIDDNVKRVLDYLDKSGLRENTVVIFTSDNGFSPIQSINNNLRGSKGTAYEGGIRVPAIVSWPGKINPSINEEIISAVDWFPTFIDLANITGYNEFLDGKSVVPLLHGRTLGDRATFWHNPSMWKTPANSIIRKGPWKLIQFLNDGQLELYNLDKDLKESRNLIEKEKVVARKLLSELVQWRKDNKVPLPAASKLKY